MITYIELWKATPAWQNISQEERSNYINQLGPFIQNLLENGVQIISWGVNDQNTYQRIDYDFFAVWSFPDANSAQEFEEGVVGAGWYTYFEQINARGLTQTPPDVLSKMIAL
ncbi:DUF6616 family protein [Adhaeribacter radiodurans]|uniref:DUF1330 domain-containing protein n=1 Tax=Adhaeribacter radiodurans TaxID=2745197 RepID=A0A7L7L7N7_9BACT|nr:DUF6616 family protein [Adhaeribacter radiodurans]QMU28851.1 hypothetical protein HUW48_12745 [Adhaeribacter radiodurans]